MTSVQKCAAFIVITALPVGIVAGSVFIAHVLDFFKRSRVPGDMYTAQKMDLFSYSVVKRSLLLFVISCALYFVFIKFL